MTNAQVVTSEISFKNTLMFANDNNQSLELITEKGYYKFDDKTGEFNAQTVSGIEKISNHLISNETYLTTNILGKTYFLLNGGGELYSISNQVINREDYSFAHKNQFNGHLFTVNNRIYYYGGYGFYRSKDFFVFFNNPTLDWQILTHENETVPRGRMNALFQTFEHKIYVAGGIHASGKNNITELNDVFSFDTKEKTFSLLGTLNSKIQNTVFKWYTPTHLNFGLFINNKHQLVKISLPDNQFETYIGLESLLKNNNSPLTVVGDSLYFITTLESQKYLNRIALKKLILYKNQQGDLFEKTKEPNYTNIIFILLGLLTLFVFFKIFKLVDSIKNDTPNQ